MLKPLKRAFMVLMLKQDIITFCVIEVAENILRTVLNVHSVKKFLFKVLPTSCNSAYVVTEDSIKSIFLKTVLPTFCNKEQFF